MSPIYWTPRWLFERLKTQNCTKNVLLISAFVAQKFSSFWKLIFPRILHQESQKFHQLLRFTSSQCPVWCLLCAKSYVNDENWNIKIFCRFSNIDEFHLKGKLDDLKDSQFFLSVLHVKTWSTYFAKGRMVIIMLCALNMLIDASVIHSALGWYLIWYLLFFVLARWFVSACPRSYLATMVAPRFMNNELSLDHLTIQLKQTRAVDSFPWESRLHTSTLSCKLNNSLFTITMSCYIRFLNESNTSFQRKFLRNHFFACLNRAAETITGNRWQFLGSCGRVSTQLRRKQSMKF